jgi:hypothetical protein
MQIRLLTAIGLILLASGVLAQAYRWVDKDGVVHYSDRPEPGAEEVQLPVSRPSSGPTTPAASSPYSRSEEAPESDANQPFSYQSLSIAAPASEQTLWNIEGVLNVSLSLQPGLRSGHQVRVYFDGSPRMVSGTSFQLEEVYRGAHNLQAEVIDQAGKLMIRSEPSRFYVQQNAIAN